MWGLRERKQTSTHIAENQWIISNSRGKKEGKEKKRKPTLAWNLEVNIKKTTPNTKKRRKKKEEEEEKTNLKTKITKLCI